MRDSEREDVIVVGWLRGDDYEAALAYRRRDRPRDKHQGKTPAKHQSIATRLIGRGRPATPDPRQPSP
jgi:hypothetical protein